MPSSDSSAENVTRLEEIASFFGVDGTYFLIDCHKRTTAQLVEARFEYNREVEATVWDGHYVAAVASTRDAAEEVRETIPEQELVEHWREASA